MERRVLARRLSSLDALFLYIETPEAPLQIGGIEVFDGPISRQRLIERLARRLDEIPRYRQRIVPAPLGLGHPFWEDAPGFDLHDHVLEIAIDGSQGDSALQACAARLFERVLPRDRPLWDIHVVRGLEGDRTGLVFRIHHAMVDGLSGVELLDVMFETTPEGEAPRRPAPLCDSGHASFVSRLADVASDAAADVATTGLGWLREAGRLFAGGREPIDRGFELAGALGHAAGEPVMRLPFNRALTGARRLGWTSRPSLDVRRIRTALGGTLNDVVLAVVTDAVGRFLRDAGEPIAGRSLRLMVPVNVRREDERGVLGNRVSMVPVEAPFDGEPASRLRAVQDCTARLKSAHLAEVVEELATLGGLIPAPLYAAALAFSARPGVLTWSRALRDLPPLHANVVCTNVPGPRGPLYAQGQRLLAHYPVVPLAFEFGLSFAAFTYDERLFFGLIADGGAIDDLGPLTAKLERAFDDLREAAGGD